jgi:hypothetical protein
MGTIDKLLGGLIMLTALVVIVRDPGGVNTVLGGLADFNNKTFGTFIRPGG